jgi:hypothetical protein
MSMNDWVLVGWGCFVVAIVIKAFVIDGVKR